MSAKPVSQTRVNIPRCAGWLAPLFAALTMVSSAASAERLVLRNGFVITGDVKIEGNRIIVRSGPRFFCVGGRQLLKPQPADDLESPVRIVLDQPAARPTRAVESLVNIVGVDPFDVYGRRSLRLRSAGQPETSINQAIVELHPSFVLLQGINRSWRSAEWTSQIPSSELIPILQKGIDPKNAVDRLKVADFLVQAGRFQEAKGETESVRRTFPEHTTQVAELAAKLDRRIAAASLNAMRQAMGSGQWQRAKAIAAALSLRTVPAEMQHERDALNDELTRLHATVDAARAAVTRLRAAEQDASERIFIEAALSEIATSLSPATVHRLEPFLKLAASAEPRDRLALAISGWVLGADLAHRDLADALVRWRQFVALREAMHTLDDSRFQSKFDALNTLGTDAYAAGQMIPLVPAPPLESDPDAIRTITVKIGETETRAHVLLPPEYDPYREYPAVVTLHGVITDAKRQLQLWAPSASAAGYILVAPEHRLDATQAYRFSGEEHRLLSSVLVDMRRRFAVDADRVFLSGHDLGGVIAWDYGMAHPDNFAGLVPFTGSPQFYCVRYWPNLAGLPVYSVEGGLNGDNAAVTRAQCERFFQNGMDVVYVEYPGRGRELFGGELPTVFQWMQCHRRDPFPREVDVVTARLSDRRFYWLHADSFLPRAVIAPDLFHQEKFRPARLEGRVTDQNAIVVTTSGLDGMSLRLSPRLVALDAPELTVRVNKRLVHRGPIKPDLATMLDELRRTGDRKMLVAQKIVVPRL